MGMPNVHKQKDLNWLVKLNTDKNFSKEMKVKQKLKEVLIGVN